MSKHVNETFVAVAHAPSVAEKIFIQARDFCQSTIIKGSDKLLNFEGARAIIRPTDDGLFFRVSAPDIVTLYGIRTLIEGSLWKFESRSVRPIEWLPAQRTPFRAIYKRKSDGQNNSVIFPSE